ncbi:uncharacterized protein FTOL_13986 [Fusarium torulosum]|uniref:Uncharacterized protein n=1 Tax=Fusarium torulosum TaxID=33205 RepID=A0AAE8MPT6_9HYPO|nr:uncharacterized protein FTOL_13986 [Fusarium torulosum]
MARLVTQGSQRYETDTNCPSIYIDRSVTSYVAAATESEFTVKLFLDVGEVEVNAQDDNAQARKIIKRILSTRKALSRARRRAPEAIRQIEKLAY